MGTRNWGQSPKKDPIFTRQSSRIQREISRKIRRSLHREKKPSSVIFDLQDQAGKYFRHVQIGNLKPYQEPVYRANEVKRITVRPGTGNPAINPWQRGKHRNRGNTPTELMSKGQAQRPAPSRTSRSATTLEQEMAALEAELEAEGFLRFSQIGPLYDRVRIQHPTTRRPTRPN